MCLHVLSSATEQVLLPYSPHPCHSSHVPNIAYSAQLEFRVDASTSQAIRTMTHSQIISTESQQDMTAQVSLILLVAFDCCFLSLRLAPSLNVKPTAQATIFQEASDGPNSKLKQQEGKPFLKVPKCRPRKSSRKVNLQPANHLGCIIVTTVRAAKSTVKAAI